MSDIFFNEETENYQKSASNGSVRKNINDLNVESKSAVIQIGEMRKTVADLKCELQSVVDKVEQNVETFKGKVTSKIGLMLDLLSKKQAYIQNTLNNCYKIIDNLVENFLNIGYELEKDITTISLKINDFDTEIKKLDDTNCEKVADDATLWFVNSKGRLTKRKNIVLSSILPQFKCGDKKMRQSFIRYLEEVFSAFQVPETLWVSLASSQLTGMAYDWWNLHDKSMSWSQFIKCFLDWTFSENIRRKIITPTKRHSHNSFVDISEPTPTFSSESTSKFLSESTSKFLSESTSKFLSESTSNFLAKSNPKSVESTTKFSLESTPKSAESIPKSAESIPKSAESTTICSIQSIPKSDTDTSDEDSGTISSTSSFKLCKKKKYSFVMHNTKNKEILKVNRKSKNTGVKSPKKDKVDNQKKLHKLRKRKHKSRF